MFKIRVLAYRVGIQNLQTKIVSFAGQQILLKEVLFNPAVYMNGSTKNSRIKHCPFSKYAVL